MRRLLAIFLLLVFGTAVAAPLFVPSADRSLPACCRRAGTHHCAGMGDGNQSGVHVRMTCPRYRTVPAAVSMQTLGAGSDRTSMVPVMAHPCGQAQTEARCRIAFSRSRQKRGPPSPSVA